ncbi:P-loop NTPase [Aerococcaceae bacterium DSM 109652]|uniref:P-loop NTPase n=1 Tax=Fundicoccus ignavus TaxID=2664442 RepID=A0A844CCJ5_9LACT|nr:P-loop NTPase [Fundicoccus ignavus]
MIVTCHPHSVNSERFRALRTNLLFAQRTQGIQSVLITSSVLSEGKSFVTVNLATVLAQTNKKVLLVDADLRKTTLHTILNLENEEGLTSYYYNKR